MKRLVVVVMLALVLGSVAGCVLESSDPGEDDGLHTMVPNVVGLDEASARQMLEDEGYAVGEVSAEPSGDAEPGIVLEQSPIGSTSAPRGSAVDLVVASP